MKASELRIGNLIQIDIPNSYVESVTWEIIRDLEQDPQEDSFKPISLTEEWLKKFGFKYDVDTDCYHYYNFILNKLFVMMDIDIHICIKYVHQLQNLYFALTGEEL